MLSEESYHVVMTNCVLDYTIVECMINHLRSEDAISVKTLGIGLLNAIVIMVKHVQSVPHWNMKLEIVPTHPILNA